MSETVAVLGAGGTMGSAMARNLLGAGFAVRAWNRTAERAKPLEADGAVLAATPAEAALGASFVLTMLRDGEAVIAAMDGPDGALRSMTPTSGWLQMSTIGEAATARCAELAQEHAVAFLDAPVLGTKEPAQRGELVILASGAQEEALRRRVAPLFDALGKKTLWLGEAGEGTRLKLVTNAWVLTVAEGTAEAIAFAEGLGLDPRLLLDAVEGGPLDLPYLRIKAEAIMTRDFKPSFKLALAAKDAGLMEESAQGRGLDLPLIAAIRRRLMEAAAEHGEEDVIASYLASARATGDSGARSGS
jgi:3-hydroxyisobutyrate dehydrogenase